MVRLESGFRFTVATYLAIKSLYQNISLKSIVKYQAKIAKITNDVIIK